MTSLLCFQDWPVFYQTNCWFPNGLSDIKSRAELQYGRILAVGSSALELRLLQVWQN